MGTGRDSLTGSCMGMGILKMDSLAWTPGKPKDKQLGREYGRDREEGSAETGKAT
jgi:hypothetical protein